MASIFSAVVVRPWLLPFHQRWNSPTVSGPTWSGLKVTTSHGLTLPAMPGTTTLAAKPTSSMSLLRQPAATLVMLPLTRTSERSRSITHFSYLTPI